MSSLLLHLFTSLSLSLSNAVAGTRLGGWWRDIERDRDVRERARLHPPSFKSHLPDGVETDTDARTQRDAHALLLVVSDPTENNVRLPPPPTHIFQLCLLPSHIMSSTIHPVSVFMNISSWTEPLRACVHTVPFSGGQLVFFS